MSRFTKSEYKELLQNFNYVVSILIRLIDKEITPKQAKALLESIMTGVNAG